MLAACSSASFFSTPSPVPQPTATSDPRSSARVVQAFWDALGAGDLDTAMVYVADDITCAGYCHFTGKVTFRSYLQGYLDGGFVTRISDLKNVGNMVTYSWEVHRNGLFLRRGEDDEIMEVEDGKIVYWENYHR
jgi:limonene-1,2-epoxide hydrolase